VLMKSPAIWTCLISPTSSGDNWLLPISRCLQPIHEILIYDKWVNHHKSFIIYKWDPLPGSTNWLVQTQKMVQTSHRSWHWLDSAPGNWTEKQFFKGINHLKCGFTLIYP
jgi:hypothetical protein